jgi:DNA relaxase NicK
MVAPESIEGEKSPTWVKFSVRRKSNIEVLMNIYSFMGSYWFVLMGSCEKFRTSNFSRGFWLAIHKNLMMADLLSQIEGVRTFFL